MLYGIENERLLVQVRSQGAELRSVKERRDETEYLWNGDPAWWKYSSPVLFPIVGKLVEGKYRVEGKTYELPPHGLARTSEFALTEQTKESIRFALDWSEETLKIFPWKFRLEIGYRLEENKVRVSWQVENKDSREMFFSIGAHPALRCPIVRGEALTDCYLELNRSEDTASFAITPDVLFKQEKGAKLTGQKIPLSDAYFRDGVRAFDDLKSDSITIRSEKSDKSVTIAAPGFTHWGLWAPEKGGAPFVCLEPWYGHADFADFRGEFKDKDGVLPLKAADSFRTEYVIAIGE